MAIISHLVHLQAICHRGRTFHPAAHLLQLALLEVEEEWTRISPLTPPQIPATVHRAAITLGAVETVEKTHKATLTHL
jgi:hypothetical protein